MYGFAHHCRSRVTENLLVLAYCSAPQQLLTHHEVYALCHKRLPKLDRLTRTITEHTRYNTTARGGLHSFCVWAREGIQSGAHQFTDGDLLAALRKAHNLALDKESHQSSIVVVHRSWCGLSGRQVVRSSEFPGHSTHQSSQRRLGKEVKTETAGRSMDRWMACSRYLCT